MAYCHFLKVIDEQTKVEQVSVDDLRKANEELARRCAQLESQKQRQTVCSIYSFESMDSFVDSNNLPQPDNSMALKVAELEARIKRRDQRIKELSSLKHEFVSLMTEKDREILEISTQMLDEVRLSSPKCQLTSTGEGSLAKHNATISGQLVPERR
jgi:hypothetical protein